MKPASKVLIVGARDSKALSTLRACLDTPECDVLHLTFSDIVRDLEFAADIESAGVTLTWKIGDVVMTPANVTGVYYDLYESTPADLGEFGEDDREFVLDEYLSYLQFAIGQFRTVINPPRRAICTDAPASLIQQWSIARRVGLSFSIPQWQFGRYDRLDEELASDPRLIVSLNPFESQAWKPRRPNDEFDVTRPVLCVIAPSGSPLIATVNRSEVFWSKPLREAGVSKPACADRVTQEIIDVVRELGLDVATVLLFFDPTSGRITFGSVTRSFNPDYLTPADLPRFLGTLQQGLTGELR
jgi:hypothetical protein